MNPKVTHCDKCTTLLDSTSSEWWRKCLECGQFYFLYEPMPHQLKFHNDPARFKFFAGGKKSHSPLKTIQIRGNSKDSAMNLRQSRAKLYMEDGVC